MGNARRSPLKRSLSSWAVAEKGGVDVRIIAGKWRGKKIIAPTGLNVRPTSDRGKGALYDLLTHGKPAACGFELRDTKVLDAFAGTGALGLEALSRGAAQVTFMENAKASHRAICTNVSTCQAESLVNLIETDVLTAPRAMSSCDLIHLDPPYGKGLVAAALQRLETKGWIAKGAICCAELGKDETLAIPEGFRQLEDRRYGAARIVILKSVA